MALHKEGGGWQFECPKVAFICKADMPSVRATSTNARRVIDAYGDQVRRWSVTGLWWDEDDIENMREEGEEEEAEEDEEEDVDYDE